MSETCQYIWGAPEERDQADTGVHTPGVKATFWSTAVLQVSRGTPQKIGGLPVALKRLITISALVHLSSAMPLY
jgi:hypothetical protein